MTHPISPGELPQVIADYLARRESADPASVAALFAPDAVVFDEGRAYTGPEEILGWIRETRAKYEYTVTLLSAQADTGYTVTNRVEGNFPGGTVDLQYQFRLNDDGTIQQLLFA